jgi:hypothetical protein
LRGREISQKWDTLFRYCLRKGSKRT